LENNEQLFDKFKKIIAKSNRIRMSDLVLYLNINREKLLPLLVEWSNSIPIIIDKEELTINNPNKCSVDDSTYIGLRESKLSDYIKVIDENWDLKTQNKNLPKVGTLKSIKISKDQCVKDFLQEYGLDGTYFTIIVNGKRVNPDETIKKDSTIILLPKISGG
jgi:hypothetical protein